MSPTEQAHQNVRNLLLNGRILVNGQPPTATEIGNIIAGEQMLFEKATQLDKSQNAKKDEKAPKIIPLEQPKK